jgi:FixJ family two-component response regulator
MGAETVHIVDDDASTRASLARMLRYRGFEARSYSSAGEFLAAVDPTEPGCAILDYQMPEIDGLAVQRMLSNAGGPWQLIFLTGHGNIPTCVQAMKGGAINFFAKPVVGASLVKAVEAALERHRAACADHAKRRDMSRRVDALTPRESQVMELLIAGRMNKQIAGELGTAEKTVKIQRAHVMRKMGVNSVAELVRMTEKLGIRPRATLN